MKLYLDGERTYKFGGNPEAIALAHAKLGRHAYVIDYTRDGISGFEFTKIEDSGRR